MFIDTSNSLENKSPKRQHHGWCCLKCDGRLIHRDEKCARCGQKNEKSIRTYKKKERFFEDELEII